MTSNRQIDITSFELSEPMWELGATKISFYIDINFDPDKYFGIDQDTFDCIDEYEEYQDNHSMNFYAVYDASNGNITGDYVIYGDTWTVSKKWEFNPDEKVALLQAMNDCTIREDGVNLRDWIQKYQ